MNKSLGIGFPWVNLEEPRAAELLVRLRKERPEVYEGWDLEGARYVRPRFYRRHALVEVRLVRGAQNRVRYLLDGPDALQPLDGRSDPIQRANAVEALALDGETALDYLRFFAFFLLGSEGPFTLLETEVELDPSDGQSVDAEREQFRGRIRPMRIGGQDGKGRFLVPASIAYDGTLWRTTLAVSARGEVEMIDEKEPLALGALRIPQSPYTDPSTESAEAKPATGNGSPPAAALAEPPAEEVETPLQPAGLEDTASDRDATRAVVSGLLADAVRERIGNTLLRRFNSQTHGDEPVAQLARFVRGSHPIVIIESEIPFIEDIVAGLLEPELGRAGKPAVNRAKGMPGDDSRCSLDPSAIAPGGFLLVSFHAYRSLWDAESVAHQLASHHSTVLIGCDRQSDVPDPLRRAADLVLTLPRIEPRLFARIFTHVFSAPPPANWDLAGADWTRYLIAADFHVPLRLKLTASQATQYLRQRVRERLRQVSPVDAPGVSSLHGLGEARQTAEDLVDDIRAAQTDALPRDATTRGLLLVGPPGVGKTTLARAIARDAGVRFIVASAANWLAAGALDIQLRALRSDFTEARRYAPSILFIDDLDSIGSHEPVPGSRSHHRSEIAAALLEQLQGVRTRELVVVLGATNNVDRVDPALRRAGRLEQTIAIPLPNIAVLQRMFAERLAPHRSDGNVAVDVNERQLAELAFGLTGADVDCFVRSAARRARTRGRPIGQDDLVEAVMHRPPASYGTRRRPLEEIRRAAVHQGGHAIVQLTSKSSDKGIAFATIIPRADGWQGCIATRSEYGMTRRVALERIETALAGRAAEQLVYGKDGIGLATGGPGTSSDLAVATRIATQLVCEGGPGLQWTGAPTPAQSRQIDRLLLKAYRSALARLRANRALLDRLSEALVVEQVLDRHQLCAILAAHEMQRKQSRRRGAAARARRGAPTGRRRR